MASYESLSDIVVWLRKLQQQVADIAIASSPEARRNVGDASQPAFENSWVNFDASASPTGRAAAFYRHEGRVYLSGVIKAGASTTTAFTLPAGYLPIDQTNDALQIPVACSGGIGQVSVRTNGEIRPSNVTAGTNVSTYCFLDGVSFRHA